MTALRDRYFALAPDPIFGMLETRYSVQMCRCTGVRLVFFAPSRDTWLSRAQYAACRACQIAREGHRATVEMAVCTSLACHRCARAQMVMAM